MPAISGDGRFVVFVSLADNLVPGDTNSFFDMFVHDRLTNITERVSVDSHERQGNNDSGLIGVAAYPAISADGRFVAFVSQADNLVYGDRNVNADVFVRDRLLDTTERVSVNSAGEEADIGGEGPAISAPMAVSWPSSHKLRIWCPVAIRSCSWIRSTCMIVRRERPRL